MAQVTLKVGDRVIRAFNNAEAGYACEGTVKEIREETIQQGDSREKEKPVIIGVQWDNGTVSFFGPGGLRTI